MPVKDIKWWLEFIYILIDRYSSSFFWCCCCCFWWLDLTLYSTRLYSIRHDSRHDMQIGYEVHAKAFVNFNSHILTSFHIFMHVFCVCFCDWGRRHRAHFPAVHFFCCCVYWIRSFPVSFFSSSQLSECLFRLNQVQNKLKNHFWQWRITFSYLIHLFNGFMMDYVQLFFVHYP